jgi:hypothetical protein
LQRTSLQGEQVSQPASHKNESNFVTGEFFTPKNREDFVESRVAIFFLVQQTKRGKNMALRFDVENQVVENQVVCRKTCWRKPSCRSHILKKV